MERRRENRIPADQPVTVRVLSGLRRTHKARVLDVSPSGLRIRFARPFALGTPISVPIFDELVFGKVRYCEPAEDGYDAGIVIEYAIRATQASA